ncbi:hypothetical protein PAMP_019748 [Pampus punctatissimus]
MTFHYCIIIRSSPGLHSPSKAESTKFLKDFSKSHLCQKAKVTCEGRHLFKIRSAAKATVTVESSITHFRDDTLSTTTAFYLQLIERKVSFPHALSVSLETNKGLLATQTANGGSGRGHVIGPSFPDQRLCLRLSWLLLCPPFPGHIRLDNSSSSSSNIHSTLSHGCNHSQGHLDRSAMRMEGKHSDTPLATSCRRTCTEKEELHHTEWSMQAHFKDTVALQDYLKPCVILNTLISDRGSII